MSKRWLLVRLAAGVLLLVLGATPLMGQGKSGKGFEVSDDRAVTVTKEVLVKDGFDVVRVERVGETQVVYYRRGNMGKGKGKGPIQKMVIRRVSNRIVFEETPADILVNIELKLRL